METTSGRATRTTVFSAVLFAFVMIGVPSFFTGGNGSGIESAGLAAAADDLGEDGTFIVGISELTVSTLNPNTYTMVSEALLIFPCYSTLLQYDEETGYIIGDLAYNWSSSPDMMTWTFELVKNAYFCDPADPTSKAHQVTVNDVMFSFWNLQNNTESRLHTYVPDVIGSITTNGLFELTINLKKPYVAWQDALTGVPILPEYYWSGKDFVHFGNDPPIGSAAFYYSLDSSPNNGIAILERNPIWYQEDLRGWQVHTQKWIIQETSTVDTGWQMVKAGEIDVMLGVTPSLYTLELDDEENLIGFAQNEGFVYEMNLNQMSDQMRKDLGGSFSAGESNPLLLDPAVRKAVAMCVDKDTIVEDILLDLGEIADSLVPAQNPWHRWETAPIEFDTAQAKLDLIAAGYTYNALKEVDPNAFPLCNKDGDPLEFNFYTLDTSPVWDEMASAIVKWCAEAGIKLNKDIKTVNEMNTIWYSADYDMWLWDWVFSPISEPATGCLVVLTTDAIGTDSDVYWSNATYDALYEEVIGTFDPVRRKEIYDEMQRMAYWEFSCQTPAYRKELYAVYTGSWTNFGDWNNSYWLLPDIWNQWLAMKMSPKYNEAPSINYWSSPQTKDSGTQVNIGDVVDFSASASNDYSMPFQFKWFFGDGTSSAWSSSGEAQHTYTQDGNYTVYVACKETTADEFQSWRQTWVEVYDMSNDAPVVAPIVCSPETGIDSATLVTFTGSATDEEDQDDLMYSWAFGDGSLAVGQEVTHQFSHATADTPYTVTLSVTDNHYGAGGERPIQVSKMVIVALNDKPTVTVPMYSDIKRQTVETFSVVASDEEDDLRFTWFWGDGDFSVTDVASATHKYVAQGEYTLTVWADDLTELDGHNVSGSNSVYVYNPSKNNAPVIDEFSVDDSTPYTGQLVTFYATAADADGDGLKFTYDFGDGTYAVESFGPTAENDPVDSEVTHIYTTAGAPTAFVNVYDGTDNVTSSPVSITVTLNRAPVIYSLDCVNASTGVEMTLVADVDDQDSTDTLTYYWDWDDGTFSTTTGPTATHTYDAADEYVPFLFVNDGHSHNVSRGTYVWVNTIPEVDTLVDFRTEVGAIKTYIPYAFDADEDELTCTWEFGDGTTMVCMGDETVDYAYTTEGTWTLKLYVDDGFNLASHNVSTECEVNVIPEGDYPPEIEPLSDLTGTVNEPITFSAKATDPDGDPLKYTWDFDDGTYAVGQTIAHTYSLYGVYTYSVWVDDGTGFNVSDSATATILPDEAPVAVAGSDRTVEEDVNVVFDGHLSTDDVGIVTWTWTVVELDDEFYGEYGSYEFVDPGVYTVTLVVTDTVGQDSLPDSITVTVTDETAPVVIGEATPSPADMHDTVTLDASDSYDEYGDVVSWVWEFYDGVDFFELSGETVTHVFDVAGGFPVDLTVTDDSGNYATITVTVTITDTEAPFAVAGDDDTIDQGDEYTFDGSLSTDNYDDELNYTWTFDDDGAQTLYGETPSYTFLNAGEFEVTLTVRDDELNTATDTVLITVNAVVVNDPPVADAGDDASITVGTEHTFDGSGSSADVNNYTWTFVYDGSPVVLYGVGPSYTFEAAGVYTVTLNVTDSEGLWDTDTVTITVTEEADGNEAPVAVATADPTTIKVGETVTFDGTDSTDDVEVVSYVWTFTYDGETQTLTGPTKEFTFDIAGTYVVTLTVTDADGETDTATVTITVEDDDSSSFIETYGLALAAVAAIVVVAAVALMLMKRKGGKSASSPSEGVEGIDSGEPGPPTN